MQKPKLSFIVPGFSKCGTTTLCSLLDMHPDIYIPPIKELNFFNNLDYQNHWQDYCNFFADSIPGQCLGEGSVFYSTIEFEAMSRDHIFEHYPDIKLIFIARDPISRVESSYREYHHSGAQYALNTPFSLEESLTALPGIIEDTRYWSRLNCYKDYFGDEAIHIVLLEDLKADAKTELKKCFEFLGVDSSVNIEDTSLKLNSGADKFYDSRLLRRIRTTPHLGQLWAKVPIPTQERIARPVGLRQRFRKDIHWEPAAVAKLLEAIDDEMVEFLRFCNKPSNAWPKLESYRSLPRS